MSSHSTRGTVEFLFAQGGPHSAAFVLGFSGERDTPLRIKGLGLPDVDVKDDVDDSPSSGVPLGFLSGWVQTIVARVWLPTLAPHI
jgi:hypothetical protein